MRLPSLDMETANVSHPGAAGTALQVRELACQRGERLVVEGLDFGARGGDIVWVRGVNGSGKTTLLRTLAGLSPPAAGSIDRGDLPLVYVAHANALKDDLSAAEALRFLLRLDGFAANVAEVDQALARFAIGHRRDAPTRTLSQGQRRRVALARLAAQRRAALWLLDEPFDALDSQAMATLMDILVEHVERGGIVVLSSHVPLPGARVRPIEVELDGERRSGGRTRGEAFPGGATHRTAVGAAETGR